MPLNKAAFEHDDAHVTLNKGFDEHRAEILVRLRDEIRHDPKGLGYAGKSSEEIAVLLNAPNVRNLPPPLTAEQETPRFAWLFLGAPYVNNIVAPDEIEAALAEEK